MNQSKKNLIGLSLFVLFILFLLLSLIVINYGDTFGKVFLLVSALILYFVPTYIAIRKNHKYKAQITIINVFLGFSLIGWVGALIWATMLSDKEELAQEANKPKSKGIAIILLLLFGYLGLHKFYLGLNKEGFIFLIGGLIAIFFCLLNFPVPLLFLAFMLLIDLIFLAKTWKS